MRRTFTRALAGSLLLAAASLAGCKDFLTKEGVATDPNNPTAATRDQLFVGAQSALFALEESGVPQFVCLIMQACSDVGGRLLNDRANYGFTSDDFNPDFSLIYLGGGLQDIRQIEATKDGDQIYAGIAKVLEALVASFA